MQHRLSLYLAIYAVIVVFAAGCSGPEAKKMVYLNKGKAFLEQGDYTRARLEVRNAIQIDPRFTEAYYVLGLISLRTNDLQGAFSCFSKAVALDSAHKKAHVELGKIYLAAKEKEKAMEEADLVLKLEPGNEAARILRAAALIADNQNDNAISQLKELLKEGSRTPDAFLLLAGVHIRKGYHGEAEAIIKKGLEMNPKSLELYSALGQLYTDQRRMEDAVSVATRMIEMDPGQPLHKLNLAGLYWDLGREDKARAILKDFLSKEPKRDHNWLQVSVFYLSRKKMGDAAQTLKEGMRFHPKSFAVRFALSNTYLEMEKTDDAITILNEVVNLAKGGEDRNAIEAKNTLARIYLARRDIASARRYLDEVIKDSPKDVEAHYLRGDMLLALGDGASAISEFRTITAERPDFISGYVKLAQAHVMTGEMNLAIDTLQNALNSNPGSKEASRALARLYALQRDYKKAESRMRAAIQENPDDLDARADLGDLYMTMHEYARAESAYEEMKKKDPKSPYGYVKMGDSMAFQGRWEYAAREYEQAYGLSNSSKNIMELAVGAFIQTKNYEKALSLCELRIRTNPDDALSWNLAGRIHAITKEPKRAQECFLKAISLQPLWLAPHIDLARFYITQGRTAEAVQQLESSIRSNPDNIAAYLTLAQVYGQTDDYKRSISIYERLLKKDPDLWVALNDLAYLLSEYGSTKKELARAMKFATQARKQRPDEASVLDTLGWINYRNGDLNNAVELLRQANARNPRSPVINYHLGMAYNRLEKKAEAREHLRKALDSKEHFPGREEARKVLGGS